MNEAAIRALVDDLTRAWNDRDLNRFIGFLDESIVWDDPAMLYGPAIGRTGVRKYAESILRAFPDFSYSIREPICIAPSGERCIVPWEITATHTGSFDPPGFAPTNQTIKIQGTDVLDLKDLKITRIDTYFNVIKAAEQALRIRPFPKGGMRKRIILWLQRRRARRLRRTTKVKR